MCRYIGRLIASVIFLFIACCSSAFCQSAFDDASGESSIYINDGGFARVNVSDTSVKTGFVFDMTNKPYFFGVELSGKLSGSFASLFEAGKPSPEARIRLSFGKRFLFSDEPQGEPTPGHLTDDWITLHLGYRRANYKLVAEGETFANQVRKQPFDGFSAILAYNALFKSKHGPILFGISGGAEHRNNIDELDEVEVNDQVFTSADGTTQRSIVAKQKAFRGAYERVMAAPINTDLVFFPRKFESRIGFNFFTRSNVGQGEKRIEPGIGVFFTKPGEPTKVIGGLSVSLRDGKGRFGLIAGFNF